MQKRVTSISFWKDRIRGAAKRHFMVYVTSEGDWQRINYEHEKILRTEIKQTDKVLDAGCGYGRWAHLFSMDNYVGVDLSPDFVEMAHLENIGWKFIEGKLESLPFQDGEFDVAFCVSIKEMIIDNCGQELWDAMQRELKRVAKKLLILEYTNPAEYEAY